MCFVAFGFVWAGGCALDEGSIAALYVWVVRILWFVNRIHEMDHLIGSLVANGGNY